MRRYLTTLAWDKAWIDLIVTKVKKRQMATTAVLMKDVVSSFGGGGGGCPVEMVGGVDGLMGKWLW